MPHHHTDSRPSGFTAGSGAALLALMVGCLVAGRWSALSVPESLPQDYVSSQWRIEDGLPSSRVQDLVQTQDGYLWVATFNGLARFDGVRFQQFNDANTPALRNSLISSLFEDRKGNLWIGSDTGEIAWKDPQGFHALEITHPWSKNPIDRFVEDAAGTVWAMSRGFWLLPIRDFEAGETVAAPAGGRFFDITADNEGGIWIILAGGAIRRLQPDDTFTTSGTPSLRGPGFINFAPARAGGLWIRQGGTLRRWESDAWMENRGQQAWPKNQGVQILETQSGNVAVGSLSAGVYLVAPNGDSLHLDRPGILSDNSITSLAGDYEGNLWVGTTDGLNLLKPRSVSMINPPDRWQDRGLSCVTRSSTGGLWVGTDGAGLYSARGDVFEVVPMSSAIPSSPIVRSVLEDRNQTLWAGLVGGGLVRLEDGQLTPVQAPFEIPGLVYALLESSDGAVWAGTQNGLVRLKDGQWSILGRELQQADVRCLAEGPDGSIWLGMRGGGIARYANGAFTQFRKTEGLPYDYAWSLHADSDGVIWVGTSGGGLIRVADGKFTQFTSAAGLPSDFVCQIEEDEEGRLWIGSYAGIVRVSKRELDRQARGEIRTINCLVLDQSEGLTSLEMAGGNQPASCRTPDGRLWFATSGGLAMVNPDHIQMNEQAPPVWIEDVLADGIPCEPESQRSNGSTIPQVRVGPGNRQIQFDYTALSLSAPQRVRFRHRMIGLDEEWVESGNRREVNYSHLPPGKYRFEVSGCNNHGIWNRQGASVAVVVAPFFWQTWWFAPACWVGGAGILSSLVVSGLRRRHHRRVETLKREHALEQERSRIAQDLHDDLGAGLTEIDSTSALGQDESVPPEEAREFFHEISTRSREMVGALDEIVWAVNPKNDSLSSVASYMCQFAEQFLKSTPIRIRFDVPARLPDILLNSEQRYNLFLAYKEALHNAAQHSGGSKIRLCVAVEDRHLRVCVEDNGSGLDEHVQNDLSEGADGLDNMHQRMQRLGGRCTISGAAGQGTRVTFELDLPGSTTHT